MGLDNIPQPYPCLILEKAGKLKVVRDEEGRILCHKTSCPFRDFKEYYIGILGTFCWLRGKIFDDVVFEVTEYTLYDELTRKDIENILKILKERKGEWKEYEAEINYLIKYFETLLNTGWDGKLIPWG